MIFGKKNKINFMQYFLLTSCLFTSLGGGAFASVDVTSSQDNGTGQAGTLSAAINTVNGTPSNNSILLENDINPTITGSMPSITTSLSIDSSSGVVQSISSSSLYPLSIMSGAVFSLTSNIILEDVTVNIGSGCELSAQFDGSNNWTNSTIGLYGGNLEIAVFSDDDSPYLDINSDIVFTSGVITLMEGDIALTGSIQGMSGDSLTFNGIYDFSPQIYLNNTTSSNSWSQDTYFNYVAVNLNTSSSFPSDLNLNLVHSNFNFSLKNSDTYSLSGVINGDSSSYLIINSGTVNLSADIYNCSINVYGGVANLSGSISVSDIGTTYTQLYGGTTNISGDNSDYPMGLWVNGYEFNEYPTLAIEGPIHAESYIRLNQGQLNINTDLTLTSGTYDSFMSYSSTISTGSGFLFAMPSLGVQGTGSGNLTLTLTGSGTTSIGEFVLYTPASLIVEGALGGSAGLTVSGSGSMTLSAINTYTGPTNIGSECSLEVNTGASFGTSSDDVTVNSSASLINSGNITSSTFDNYGSVTLNSGSNIIVADIYYNLEEGQTSGCGTITGNYQTVGGTYPGCSPSALTIDGDAIFASGSVLSPYLDSTGVAALDVTGDVTLDSGVILEFRPQPGCYANGFEVDFLTVGGTLTGSFSEIDMGSILLTPHISYSSSGATLTVERVSLESVVQGYNAKQVGKTLDVLIEEGTASGDSTFCDVAGSLILLSQEGISAALNQLQPALFKGLAIGTESSIVRVEEALSHRLQNEIDEKHCLPTHTTNDPVQMCAKEKKIFHVWVAGIGNALQQKSTYYAGSPQFGYHENMGGVVASIDAFFANSLYAGLLGAYTSTDIKWNSNQGKGNVQSGYAGAYFSAIGDTFYGNVSMIGSLNSYDEQRTIFLPDSQPIAKNNHGGSQLLSHVDTGINLGWGWFSLRPFDSFDYIAQKERGFTENGAGHLNLSVKKSHAILIRNELGLNFAGCFCTPGSKWIISPKISWVREVRIAGSSYTAEFVNTDTPFTVVGYFPNRNLVSPGVNVTGTMLQDRLTFTAYYNGELQGNYSNHSYGGELRIGF